MRVFCTFLSESIRIIRKKLKIWKKIASNVRDVNENDEKWWCKHDALDHDFGDSVDDINIIIIIIWILIND